MNIKSIAATIAAASVAVAPNAHASSFEAHQQLWATLASTGLELKLNPAECAEEPNIFGWYSGVQDELVICQELSTTPGEEVAWTAEDLDTLRHEAHHFVQDCMRGAPMDHDLGVVYEQPLELAKDVLSLTHRATIVSLYEKYGSKVVVLELEAFAVAAINDPAEQVRDIKAFCF